MKQIQIVKGQFYFDSGFSMFTIYNVYKKFYDGILEGSLYEVRDDDGHLRYIEPKNTQDYNKLKCKVTAWR
jgi:hypothetical protein